MSIVRGAVRLSRPPRVFTFPSLFLSRAGRVGLGFSWCGGLACKPCRRAACTTTSLLAAAAQQLLRGQEFLRVEGAGAEALAGVVAVVVAVALGAVVANAAAVRS